MSGDISHLRIVPDWEDDDMPRDLLAARQRHPSARQTMAERTAVLGAIYDAIQDATSNAAIDALTQLHDRIARGDHREPQG